MLALNKILFFVDQIEPDQDLLNFFLFLAPLFKEEGNYEIIYKVFLNEPDKNFEPKVPHDLNDVLEKTFLPFKDASISVEFESQPLDSLISALKCISQRNIDLLILKFSEKNREAAIKITRNTACSVLLMPASVPDKLSKVLVPIDFSEISLNALKMALTFAEKNKLNIYFNHIYYIPEGYHSTGKSYEEMAYLINNDAKKEYQKIGKDLNLSDFNVLPSFILDDDKDPTDKILLEALENEVELIMMTSKGMTASGSEIMGNTAKALIMFNESIPMLILKNKKENADIADYIWKTALIN